jgi:hypothetical protein
MKYPLLFGFLIITSPGFSQKQTDNRINISAAKAYFNITKKLQAGTDSKLIDWNQLFNTQPYQMMIGGGGIDTAILKSEMTNVFAANNTIIQDHSWTEGENYHKLYKANQSKLEEYIKILQEKSLVDSIKHLLYRFLPQSLQNDTKFPTLFYLNYGTADATGSNGLVFNDLLQSYKIDNYKFGLLAAHEGFHAIVSSAFMQRIKKNIDYNLPSVNLLFFLENISEEGIADLIDKPLLLQKRSPVYEQLVKLTSNDAIKSKKYIKKIDSLLMSSYTSESVLEKFKSFSDLANNYGENGGHIPGRFMGMTIKKAGLLDKQIPEIENPISFFILYNKAASKLKQDNYPVFHKESIDYLIRLQHALIEK